MERCAAALVRAALVGALVASVTACGAAGPGVPAAPSVSVLIGRAPAADVVALPGSREERIAAAVDALPGIAREVLRRSGVPGMAVAVVAGDRTVYSAGFGVRSAGAADPVTPGTVFPIASLSKPLAATAAAAAMEGSGGRLSWTTPLRELLPTFAFADPMVTERATIGDAFSHRTGLATGAGDDLEDLGYDRAAILERLRLQPLDAFRASYHYSNFGLVLGAEAVAAFRGQDWADLAEELVYRPLGMASTSSRHADLLARADRAVLHAKVDGAFVARFDRDADAQAPAGGVSSTVDDMARWLRALLAGRFGGAALLAATTAQVVTGASGDRAARPGHYGFGFGVGSQPGGRVTLSHSGAFVDGAATAFAAVPDLDLGIVVLTNGAPVGAPEAVIGEFLDRVQFGAATRDWVADLGVHFAPMTAPIGDLVGAVRPAGAAPSPPDDALLGTYTNPYFGDARLSRRGDRLVLALGPDGRTELTLEPWDGARLAYSIATENAPVGSRASATFTLDGARAVALRLDTFDERGLGTFTRR